MNRKSWIFAAFTLPAALLALHGCQKQSGDTQEDAAAEPAVQEEAALEPVVVEVLLTAEVADPAAWEQKFRTHGGLFRDQGTSSPILIGSDGHMVVVSQSVSDVDAFKRNIESPETVAAMVEDGVKRDTIKVFVLDRKFEF